MTNVSNFHVEVLGLMMRFLFKFITITLNTKIMIIDSAFSTNTKLELLGVTGSIYWVESLYNM